MKFIFSLFILPLLITACKKDDVSDTNFNRFETIISAPTDWKPYVTSSNLITVEMYSKDNERLKSATLSNLNNLSPVVTRITLKGTKGNNYIVYNNALHFFNNEVPTFSAPKVRADYGMKSVSANIGGTNIINPIDVAIHSENLISITYETIYDHKDWEPLAGSYVLVRQYFKKVE